MRICPLDELPEEVAVGELLDPQEAKHVPTNTTKSRMLMKGNMRLFIGFVSPQGEFIRFYLK
jgi:hypothetical protein